MNPRSAIDNTSQSGPKVDATLGGIVEPADR